MTLPSMASSFKDKLKQTGHLNDSTLIIRAKKVWSLIPKTLRGRFTVILFFIVMSLTIALALRLQNKV